MYDKIIENYVKTMTEEDVRRYALKEGVSITDQEVTTIYYFIKEKYKDLIKEDGLKTLKTIKSSISIPLYEEIEKKYITTKNKFF